MLGGVEVVFFEVSIDFTYDSGIPKCTQKAADLAQRPS